MNSATVDSSNTSTSTPVTAGSSSPDTAPSSNGISGEEHFTPWQMDVRNQMKPLQAPNIERLLPIGSSVRNNRNIYFFIKSIYKLISSQM